MFYGQPDETVELKVSGTPMKLTPGQIQLIVDKFLIRRSRSKPGEILEVSDLEYACIRRQYPDGLPFTEDPIDKTLEDRGNYYGESFYEQTNIAQALKKVMREAPQWKAMSNDKKEAMEMIATKLSRLLYGNPNHMDSWHDIIGYARLIEKNLRTRKQRRN